MYSCEEMEFFVQLLSPDIHPCGEVSLRIKTIYFLELSAVEVLATSQYYTKNQDIFLHYVNIINCVAV